jgi:hypothetical protein
LAVMMSRALDFSPLAIVTDVGGVGWLGATDGTSGGGVAGGGGVSVDGNSEGELPEMESKSVG